MPYGIYFVFLNGIFLKKPMTRLHYSVAFKELQEYKLGDDFMVTGEPAQIAKEIINFYKSDDVVQFNFKVDGVENITIFLLNQLF